MKQILGTVSKNVINKYNIPKKFLNRKIVLYLNDKRHCLKRHLKDFESDEQFYHIMSNLDVIINNPDLVYFNKNKSTIEYYKYLEKNITIRIRIDLGYELKMKTMFPVSDKKIEDRKNRLLVEKYSKNAK